MRQELAFDDILGVGNGFLADGDAVAQLNRFLADRACAAQLIVSQRCCRRLESGSKINSRIQSDADGDRHGLIQLFILVVENA